MGRRGGKAHLGCSSHRRLYEQSQGAPHASPELGARARLGQSSPICGEVSQRHGHPESGQLSEGSPLARPLAQPGKEGVSYHLL